MSHQSEFTYTRRHVIRRIEDLTRDDFISSALAAALLIVSDDDEEAPQASMLRFEPVGDVTELPLPPHPNLG